MKKVKVAVLRAAGSNCDHETVHAFEINGAEAELIHINQLLRKEKHFSDYHILAIPGGFTYGDDVSAGKILANEIKFLLTEETQKFVDDGKLVLGICNGFQVLAKAGLLPEFSLGQAKADVTLTFNDSGRFEDRWIYLKTNQQSQCIFTKNMPPVIYLPVAHAEGKFVPKDESLLKKLHANGQVVFQYSDPDGNSIQYPGNPNGSIDGIAGICDPTGRILGLMPHPERNIHPTHHPRWTREGLDRIPDGLAIFKNSVQYAIDFL